MSNVNNKCMCVCVSESGPYNIIISKCNSDTGICSVCGIVCYIRTSKWKNSYKTGYLVFIVRLALKFTLKLSFYFDMCLLCNLFGSYAQPKTSEYVHIFSKYRMLHFILKIYSFFSHLHVFPVRQHDKYIYVLKHDGQWFQKKYWCRYSYIAVHILFMCGLGCILKILQL